MSKTTGITLFSILVILIFIITNPKEQAHKDAVRNKINSVFQKNLTQSEKADNIEDLGQGLGFLFGGLIIDKIVDNYVSTENYILFSLTKVNVDAETRTIGFGILGNVFISSQINNAISDFQNENDVENNTYTSSLSHLKSYEGKQPWDVNLLEDAELTKRLVKLIGHERFFKMKEKWTMSSLISVQNDIFIVSGNESHNTIATSFIIVIDFASDILSVGIEIEENIETFSESGSPNEYVNKWVEENGKTVSDIMNDAMKTKVYYILKNKETGEEEEFENFPENFEQKYDWVRTRYEEAEKKTN